MKKKSQNLVSNKRAFHDYEIIDTLEAGICLQGTEIKSIRNNGASLQEAYVKIISNEIWLIGCSVAPYSFGNIHNHEERRTRKLLLHKRELAKLKKQTQEKGLTIVPLSLYLNKGRVKVKIGTAKGKKNIDKRATIKDRDEKRHMQRTIKENS